MARIARPETRYAPSGGVFVAYTVSGSGPIDIVHVHGGWGHIELRWDEPNFARLLERLSSLGRLIQFDRRGTGLSDRTATPATIDEHVEDMRAVLDVVGARAPVIVGIADGAAVAIAYAASAPERVSALVLYAPYPKARGDEDAPGLAIPTDETTLSAATAERWGDPWLLDIMAPSRAGDSDFVAWWKRYQQAAVSPGAARALIASMSAIDVSASLPKVAAPTLVVHRSGDRLIPIANGRAVAARIPGAAFKELPGDDYLLYAGDVDAFADEVARFLGVEVPRRRPASRGPLTSRERDVADLVAKGLTNRQIASRLVISERTVESHVSSTLRKLGLGSRAEIAVWETETRRSEKD